MVLASVRGAGGGGERMAKAAVWATIVAMGYAQGDGTGQAQGLFPYTAHDLAVATSDGLQLGGTLLIPTPRAGGGQQRFPAAVMVHGSGPNDRDEALQLPGGSFAPFQQIAETLAGAGWVVYRYDKRTCHPDGTAGHDHCTNNIASLNVPAMRIEDFVSDAVAALELVAGRREVSITDGLAVIGHSQGAFPVGPLAAAAYPAVNKLAMLMGPSLPIDQIYLDQISRFQSPAAADVMRPAFDALNAAIANGDDPAAIDTSSLGAGANTGAFWASWMRATAPTQVSTVLSSLVARGVKLLALNSPDDVQVYPAAYEDMQTQIGRLRQRGILVRALSHDLVGSPPKESRTTAVCSTVLVGLRDFIAGTGAWGRSGGGRLTQRCEDAAQPCGDAVLRGLSDSDPELAADLQSGSTLTCGQLSDRLLEAALDPEQTDPGAIDCVAAGDLDNSQSFLVLAESCAAARAAARAADASGSNCRPIAVALDFIAAINHQRDATMPPITSALAGALTPTQLDGLASQLPCSSPTGARAQPASDDHYWTVLISCGGALDSAGVMLSVALENDSLQVAGLHTVPLEHLDRPPAERNCAASSGPQVPAPGPPPRLPASSPVPPSGCPVVVDVRSADEWEGGHVSCAQRLPVQDDAGLVSQVVDLAEGNMATPVVTYCYSGGRAGRAEAVLRSHGFTNVRNGGGYVVPPTNAAVLEALCNCVSTTGGCSDDTDGVFATVGVDCPTALAQVGGNCDFNLAPFGEQAPLFLPAGTTVRAICPDTCGDCDSGTSSQPSGEGH